jgi:hypothetical protein
MRWTMSKFSKPPPHTSTSRAPLIKLACDNIYPHCVHTNKIPLHSINTAHTTRSIIMHAHTVRASIMHAPLNMHHAMLNLVSTSMHRYFSRTTTLYRVAPNLSAHTCMPTFFVHYHSAPRSTKFKCAHPRANIFHALPLCIAPRQILACVAMHTYFPHITSFSLRIMHFECVHRHIFIFIRINSS